MSVVIAFEDAGPCRKALTIEVPAPAVDAELGRVVRDFAKEVKLQGFRKGKAPAGLIRRRFKDEIEKEVAQRLVPRYWRQAEAEKSLDPLLAPEISDVKLEGGEAMTFVAEVELRPHLEVKLEPEIELPTGDTAPTESEIGEALDELRTQNADWHVVERPAAVGDRVTGTIHKPAPVDPETEDEESAEPATVSSPLDVELGDERVWEELSLALTGKSAGQRGSFERTDEDPDDPVEITYTFEVDEVRERELPPLDDELAKKAGDFETVDALRATVTESLGHRKTEQLRNTRRQSLLDELRQRHPLELPRRVVDQQVQEMLHQQMSRLAQQGVDLDSAPIDWAGIAEHMRSDAEKLVHERLILDAVAKEQDIEVDEESFERLLAAYASQQGRSTLALRQELSESGRLPMIRGQLRRDQVLRSLLGETDPETESAPADGESNHDEDDS